MTTKVHVVNFGPDVVEVERTDNLFKTKIYPQQSEDFTVWDGKDVVVREVKTQIQN